MQALIRKAILFIVIYLMFMVGRWIVLPHLKIFPYIPPQILWVTLYNIIVYAASMVFHWVLIALVIIYIIWIIIKKYFPDFPIPLKTIFLALTPFKPLEQAGVLPLIDDVKGILTGGGGFGARLERAMNAIGNFLRTSAEYVKSEAISKAQSGGQSVSGKVNNVNPYSSQPNSTANAGSSSGGFLSSGEERQIDDEFNQCIEENTVPIYTDIESSAKLPLMIKNSQASVECRLKILDAYRKLTTYRDFF